MSQAEVWVLILGIWVLNLTVFTVLDAIAIKKDKLVGYGLSVGLYAGWLLMAQFMAVKVASIPLYVLSLYVPAGTIMFPFVYQATDYVQEVYGFKKTLAMIFTAYTAQLIGALYAVAAVLMPAAPFWKMVEYPEFMLGGVRIVIASLLTFITVEAVDAYVFKKLKEKWESKWWLRSIGSDLPSLLLDSLLFITLAFYGSVPTDALLNMVFSNIVGKELFGFLDTPWFWLFKEVSGYE